MFGPFASQEKKMRGHAANWLELAEKVYNFRRDALPAADLAELQSRTALLRTNLKEKSDVSKLQLSIQALEDVLRRTGGKVYPKSSLVENIEFFLVAAIVILGIRTYFVQPFKIPTNSMWPSYYGMTPEIFAKAADEPGTAEQAARFLMLGARSRRIDAPIDGEVMIPFGNGQSRGIVYNRIVNGRSWLVIPTKLKEYTLFVGGSPMTIRVPLDYNFDKTLNDAFFPGERSLDEALGKLVQSGRSEFRTVSGQGRPETLRFIKTGRMVRAGERVLSFDILTGDQLFVDRMSYHFIQPPVGSGFVFRTGNIADLSQEFGDQYYIKRLVGTPGDEIEILRGKVPSKNTPNDNRSTGDQGGVLMRNGKPIEGAQAFRKNNERVAPFGGYELRGILAAGQKATVPDGKFLALGDNSRDSYDSRYWGFVPGKDVVGRPLLIYYPFTRRWGPAK